MARRFAKVSEEFFAGHVVSSRSMKRKEKVDLIIISIPGLFLGILLKGSLFSTYRIKVTEMLFIRQKTLITQPSFWIWNEAGRVEVDRGRVGHAGDLPGSAEKTRFLGGVFRVQPKWLDEICCYFIFQLRSKFATKFTGAHPGMSAREGTRHFGLHEGVFELFFQNWPLRPRVSSAVYCRSKYGHVRTKRASATRGQICNFGPSLRL